MAPPVVEWKCLSGRRIVVTFNLLILRLNSVGQKNEFRVEVGTGCFTYLRYYSTLIVNIKFITSVRPQTRLESGKIIQALFSVSMQPFGQSRVKLSAGTANTSGPLKSSKNKRYIMTKTLTALAAAAAITVAAVAAPTTADARNNGGAVAAGVIGGLAAGAIIGSAVNNGYYAYGAGPAYYGAGYGHCYIQRQRVWTNYGPRWQRVRVCD
jgi:hypothetical protein